MRHIAVPHGRVWPLMPLPDQDARVGCAHEGFPERLDAVHDVLLAVGAGHGVEFLGEQGLVVVFVEGDAD